MQHVIGKVRRPRRRRGNGSVAWTRGASMDSVRHVLRGLPIQTKLKVGAPNDSYEQEADRVADRVMATPEAAVSAGATPHGIQRACAACEEESLQRQPLEEEEELQAKRRDGTQTPAIGPALGAQISGLRGGGKPLPAADRHFFEPRFGRDFSAVRVHTDNRSADLARSINARAFTLGSDVVFGQGEYQPDSDRGRRLMAHELTHVLQQGAGATSHVRRQEDEAQADSWYRSPAPTLHVSSIYFPTNSSSLDDQDGAVLGALARDYQAHLIDNSLKLHFHGFADHRGTEIHNEALSERRARAVAGEMAGLFGEFTSNYREGEVLGGGEIPDPGQSSAELNRFRRVDIYLDQRIPRPVPPVPQPTPKPVAPGANCIKIPEAMAMVMGVKQSEWADVMNCVCLLAGLADLGDTLTGPAAPFIEGLDCACNGLTLLQTALGALQDQNGCLHIGNLSAFELFRVLMLTEIAALDCATILMKAVTVLTTLGGGVIGGGGGTVAAPGPGTAAGGGSGAGGGFLAGISAELALDAALFVGSNLFAQGTPLPVAQCKACNKLIKNYNLPNLSAFYAACSAVEALDTTLIKPVREAVTGEEEQ